MRSSIAAAFLLLCLAPAARAQTTTFTYQGRLTDDAGPVNGPTDFEFRLYSADTGGTQVGSLITLDDLAVTNGLFTVALDFGGSVFNGSVRWLGIAVRPGDSVGAHTDLVPRQLITATPYAIKAGNATTVTMGTLADPVFLGTTTPTPLVLQLNNAPALRLEYPTIGSTPNLVGGYSGNSVDAGTQGAVIAGGGSASFGFANTIGIDSEFSAIGGGSRNSISSDAPYATIAGGNAISIGPYSGASAVGGGSGNNILSDAVCATIAGGFGNAIGEGASYAFAAGCRAKANHQGAFVWADSQFVDFASTKNNQFSIRASGGLRLSDSTSMQFGSTTRQMLNLWSTNYGIGVQASSLYFRCNDAGANDGFIWFKGGVHNDGYANPGGGTELMHLVQGGLYVNGALVSTSDRNAKENFQPVDTQDVLEKVAALPLSRWNYKQDPAQQHLGPMAQDFHAAFGVGPDDKHIATVDADGVALAAIQGLNQKVDERGRTLERRLAQKETEIAELQRQHADLLRRLDALEQRLK